MYKNVCKYLAIGIIGLALAVPTLANANTPQSSPSYKTEGTIVLAHRGDGRHWRGHRVYNRTYYRGYGYRYYPRSYYYRPGVYYGYPYYYSPGFSIGIGVGGW